MNRLLPLLAIPLGFAVGHVAFQLANHSATWTLDTSNARAIDGDTLRTGNTRLRLLNIDAPELPGHCRPGRHCAPGNPWESMAALQRLLSTPDGLTCWSHRLDVYQRPLVRCRVNAFAGTESDVSTILLRDGYAQEYRP